MKIAIKLNNKGVLHEKSQMQLAVEDEIRKLKAKYKEEHKEELNKPPRN